MRRRVLFSSVLALCLPASGGAECTRAHLDRSTVKIISTSMEYARTSHGSGLIFEHEGKTYVLTSDHVLYHSNGLFLHQISHRRSQQRIPITYRDSDWGRGLALLEVTRPNLSRDAERVLGYPTEYRPREILREILENPRFPTLDELSAPGEIKTEEPVTLSGYPAKSERPITFSGGILGNLSFTFPALTLIPFFLEIQNAHSEYGMSGGPAFDSKGCFLGVASHQIWKKEGNSDSFPSTLLIPAAQATAWARRCLSPHGCPPELFLRANIQLESWTHTVESDGYLFTAVPAGALPIDRRRFEISLMRYKTTQPLKSLFAKGSPGMERLYARVPDRESVRIIGTRKRGILPVWSRWEKVEPLPDSLAAALQILADPDREPIAMALWGDPGKSEEKLAELGRRLEDLTRSQPGYGTLQALGQRLQEKYGYEVIKEQDLAELVSLYPALNLSIRRTLAEIRSQLGRMTL